MVRGFSNPPGCFYVVCAPLSRSTKHFQTAKVLVASFRSFLYDRHSPGRDTTTQACRFSCFFCAAYGLLLPQTRTGAQTVRREQSLCSKNLRKFLQMPVWWYPSQVSAGHAENPFVFLIFCSIFLFCCKNLVLVGYPPT